MTFSPHFLWIFCTPWTLNTLIRALYDGFILPHGKWAYRSNRRYSLFFLIRAATMASPIPFNELHLTVCREYWVWPAWICWGPGVWIILMICACPSLCTDVTGSFHSGAIRSTDPAIIGLCMSLYGYVIFSNSPSQTFLPGIKGWFYLKMRQTCIYFNKLIIIELNIKNMWCTRLYPKRIHLHFIM